MIKLRRMPWQKPPAHLFFSLSFIMMFMIASFIFLEWNKRETMRPPAPENKTQPQPQPQPQPQQSCAGKIVPMGEKLLPVKGTQTLLVSAYLEHRTKEKQVRVISLVLRNEVVSYSCVLCCHGEQHLCKGVQRINPSHFQFAYGEADIMCPLPSGCQTASHVAVISGTDNSEVDKEFLEVKNQEVKKDSFPYNFTVCFSVMFEFDNVLQMVQTLEMLQMLGANKFVIYKTSHSPEVKHLLDYYTDKGIVEVVPWLVSKYLKPSRSWLPQLGSGDIHYFGQIAALTDCIYRNMYSSKYLALHDVDELILPKAVDRWTDLLPLLESKYRKQSGYIFRNTVFPNSVILPPPSPATVPMQRHWEKVPGVNILAHLYHEPLVPAHEDEKCKMFINPRLVFSTSVHSLHDYQGSWVLVDRDLAQMYHTRAPIKTNLDPKQLVYDGRLLSYSTKLIPAVNTVLKESGLLPLDAMELPFL